MADSPNRQYDWEAIERDYRATNLTLRELSAKYGPKHSTIAGQIKRHGWTRDLDSAVRQATNAALITHAIANTANRHEQSTTNVVLAAAEVNKQILISHRQRLTELADSVDFARSVVHAQGSEVSSMQQAATLVQAVAGLASATKVLIDKEREAYKLNDAPAEVPKPGAGATTLDGLSDRLTKALDKFNAVTLT